MLSFELDFPKAYRNDHRPSLGQLNPLRIRVRASGVYINTAEYIEKEPYILTIEKISTLQQQLYIQRHQYTQEESLLKLKSSSIVRYIISRIQHTIAS